MLFWLSTMLFIMSAYFWKNLTDQEEHFSNPVWTKISTRLLKAAGIVFGLGLIAFFSASGILSMWNSVFSDVTTSIRFKPPNGNFQNFIALQKSNLGEISMGFIRLGILAGTGLLGIAYYIRSKLSKNRLLFLFLGISLVDLFWANFRFIQTVDSKSVFIEIPLFRELVKKDQSFYRVFDLPGAFQREKGFNIIYGMRTVSGFYDNELAWYRSFHGGSQNYSQYMSGLQMVAPPSSSASGQYLPGKVRGSVFLDLLRVKYVLAKDNRGVPIYLENTSVLPHAYWVPQITVKSESEMLNYIKSPKFNPRREALIFPEDKAKISTTFSGDSISLVPAEVIYGNTKYDTRGLQQSRGNLSPHRI